MKPLSLIALTFLCAVAHADEMALDIAINQNLEIAVPDADLLPSLEITEFQTPSILEDSTPIAAEAEELDLPLVQLADTINNPLNADLQATSAASKELQADMEIAEAAPEVPYTLVEEDVADTAAATRAISIDLKQVFAGAPVIYSLLLIMSMGTMFIWLYTVLSLRPSGVMPKSFVENLRTQLNQHQFDAAFHLCQQHDTLLSKMMSSALATRNQGIKVMVEAMKSEGKRVSVTFWQRIALLNDIAIIAPMLGLLGTVLGMFYAFYDLNRSIESISGLFDGLGISVGTTVAGLVVSIVAMIFHSMTKYRLVRLLSAVDNEAHALAALMEERN